MEQAIIGGIVNASDVDVDSIVRDIVAELEAEGRKLIGLTQSGGGGELPSRCQGMKVDFIGSDHGSIPISQDLGPLATGCSLDAARLMEAAGIIRDAINDDSDLLVLSRFGKSEADGGGLIDCASHAVASGVPVLMTVGGKHLDAWREYHGGLGVELKPERDAISNWCRSIIGD